MGTVSTPAVSTRAVSTPAVSTQARQHAAMRPALIAAALGVLQRDGAAGLTVRNITAAAGCSTTGIYTYFGGKHGLVEEIFVGGFEAFDAALEPYYARHDLPGTGRAYRRWALANRTQYMVMFGGAVPDYVPSDAARGRALASFAKLAEVIHSVRPDDDAADRAYHTFATVHGYVMLELAGMAGDTEAESARLYERAIAALAAGW